MPLISLAVTYNDSMHMVVMASTPLEISHRPEAEAYSRYSNKAVTTATYDILIEQSHMYIIAIYITKTKYIFFKLMK